MSQRFKKNAPGSFYTTGECLSCGAPESLAPELLAELNDDNSDTYFLRQPTTPEEIEHACQAIEVCCVDALRYGGDDPRIIERLGNNPVCCDHLQPKKVNWLHRLKSKLQC
ncbi:ferredoxin [Duganella sp. Root1480D1]|uniref:ferredoxin n=1 Tax=Duganella sp. Root1480D1 TaxID=1736471 RepID=UPI0009E8C483